MITSIISQILWSPWRYSRSEAFWRVEIWDRGLRYIDFGQRLTFLLTCVSMWLPCIFGLEPRRRGLPIIPKSKYDYSYNAWTLFEKIIWLGVTRFSRWLIFPVGFHLPNTIVPKFKYKYLYSTWNLHKNDFYWSYYLEITEFSKRAKFFLAESIYFWKR